MAHIQPHESIGFGHDPVVHGPIVRRAKVFEALLRTNRFDQVFCAAGECLSDALWDPTVDLRSEPMQQFIDTMVRSLSASVFSGNERLSTVGRVRRGLVANAIALSHPEAEGVCDEAQRMWTESAGHSIERIEHSGALIGLALFALERGDYDEMVRAIERLGQVDTTSAAGALFDWSVAVLHSHGISRESAAYHAFRASLSGRDLSGLEGMLIWLATRVLTQRAGLEIYETVGWMREVQSELELFGTSSLVPGMGSRFSESPADTGGLIRLHYFEPLSPVPNK